MATLKDLLASGMSRDEINALLSQSYVGTDGFQQAGYEQGPPVAQEYPPSDMLPQPQYRGESMANTPQRPFAPQPIPQQPPRFAVGEDGLSRMTDRPGEVEQAPMNTIRNNSTGVVTQMPSSGRRSHDVWADGPQEIGRYQLANGTTEIIRKIPVMRDGRQSVGMERLIETPDYLNPAMIAKQKFDLNQAEIANKNKPYESAEDKAFARETAKTKGEADRAKQAAGIPGTPEYKKIQADNDSIAKAKSAKENFDRHADAMIKNIDMLIGDGGEVKQHPGLKNAVGQWDTMYPDAMVFKPTLNARRLGEALLNKASVQGLTDIRQEGTAPGSITEKEWPIFQSQGEVMSMSQGEDQYIKALKDKRDLLVQGKANVARNYNERLASRGGSQPASPASGSAASNNPAQPASEKVMSMQDVMDTAKSRGKTTDQVMKDARAAGFTIK